MEKISYVLPNFEGPLDLLLHLIAKNKLDIKSIKISEVLEQYLEHINQMRELNMDISSEFLEMAARLIYIKTVSLLPKHEEVEELRKELTGQLIEYQECKRIAKLLSEMINFGSFTREQEKVAFDTSYANTHDVSELLDAYISVSSLKHKKSILPSHESFSGIVSRKIVSVTSKIVFVLRRLWKGESVEYSTLFNNIDSKSEMVAIFLAILELTRSKRVKIYEMEKNLVLKLSKKY